MAVLLAGPFGVKGKVSPKQPSMEFFSFSEMQELKARFKAEYYRLKMIASQTNDLHKDRTRFESQGSGLSLLYNE